MNQDRDIDSLPRMLLANRHEPFRSLTDITQEIRQAPFAMADGVSSHWAVTRQAFAQGVIPNMEASPRCLRRRLARHATGYGRKGARSVPMEAVTALLKKRTEATRDAAIRTYADKGTVPKARPSSKRRPSPAQLAEAGEAGAAAYNEVFTASGRAEAR